MNLRRGAFIVFEGCDRSGKSTQSHELVKYLKSKGILVEYRSFPNYETKIGKVIHEHLKNPAQQIGNERPVDTKECIHLLFAANRWEMNKDMKDTLLKGITLIVDRYSYSGIAYSTSKGLNYEWCRACENGLLQPDAIFYLKTDIEKLIDRPGFGEERYERKDIQEKVSQIYDRIASELPDCWINFNAHIPSKELTQELANKAEEIINGVQLKTLSEINWNK